MNKRQRLDSINVLSREFQVSYYPTKADAGLDMGDLYGAVYMDEHRIRLLAGLGSARQPLVAIIDTLLHEILHIELDMLKTLRDMLHEGSEEAFVHELATALVDTLNRNGLLPPVEWDEKEECLMVRRRD